MSGNVDATPNEPQKLELEDVELDSAQWAGRGTDWFLQWLINFVSRTNISMDVSLTVGGSIVSGVLISHEQYFEATSEQLSEAFKRTSEDAAETMKKLILSFLPEPRTPDEPQTTPQYIHLADARIYSGSSGAITSNGKHWRGKVSAVEGFTFGRLSTKN